MFNQLSLPDASTVLLEPDNDRANTPTEGQPFLTKTKLHTLQGTTLAETKTSTIISEVD